MPDIRFKSCLLFKPTLEQYINSNITYHLQHANPSWGWRWAGPWLPSTRRVGLPNQRQFGSSAFCRFLFVIPWGFLEVWCCKWKPNKDIEVNVQDFKWQSDLLLTNPSITNQNFCPGRHVYLEIHLRQNQLQQTEFSVRREKKAPR